MKKIFTYFFMITVICVNQFYAQKILTLNECRQLALQNNSESKNSELEVNASRRVKNAAFTNYFPSISAGGMMFEAQKGMMEMETQGGDLPVYDGNAANLKNPTLYAYMPASTLSFMKKGMVGFINIVQPVFAGGRIINGNRLASLGEEVSVFKNKISQNEVLLKTEEQYWQLVSLEEKQKTIEKYEELLNRLLLQVNDAYASGVVMKNDVLKVKLKLSEVLLNKSKLNNGKKLALMALCQYIGIQFDSTIVLKEELKIDALPQTFQVDKNEALRKRSEYSLLEKSVEAEKLQTNMKLGELLPQAGIGVSGMYMKFDESKGNTLGMVFGTVSVPISDWWSGSYKLQERSIKEQIAENNFRNNSELLLLQIEKAWQDLTDAYKQYLLCEESKMQAEENYKINDDSYKNGLTAISDLLEAQTLLQQTKDQLADANTNYKLKTSNYFKVTGR